MHNFAALGRFRRFPLAPGFSRKCVFFSARIIASLCCRSILSSSSTPQTASSKLLSSCVPSLSPRGGIPRGWCVSCFCARALLPCGVVVVVAKKEKAGRGGFFLSRSSNAWPTAGASFFKSMLFWPFFFWSFLLRSCTFVDDEREPQKKTFVVSIYSFLFIYFFIVLSPQITQKEKIALVLISLHFFYARRRRRRRAFFYSGEWMLIEDGGESLVTSSEEEEEEEEVEIRTMMKKILPNRHAIFNQSKRREKLLRGKIPMVGFSFDVFELHHVPRHEETAVDREICVESRLDATRVRERRVGAV